MTDNGIRWIKAAKAIGGLAATLTLLAHFWIPDLPLTLLRIQLLLLLIGALLGLDILWDRLPVKLDVGEARREVEDK